MLAITTATPCLVYSFIVFLLVYYVLFVYKNFKLLKFACSVNGTFVPFLPFVGTIYLGLFADGDNVNVLSSTDFFKKTFGFPCNAWIGHHYLFFNTDPQESQVILNHPKCIDKPVPFYSNFHALSKNSLFLVPYHLWKPRRKHFMKSYKPKVLKTYMPFFYKQSCELLKELKNRDPKESLFVLFNKYSFTNFFLTSVGLEEEKIDYKVMREFGHLLEQVQDLASQQIIDPITPMEVWMRFFPKGWQITKVIKRSKAIVMDIIQQKKAQQADMQEYTENANELPLMDLMLHMNGKKISDDEIFEEMVLFSAAATETSGNVISFCFICLGMFKEIQEKLYNEVMTEIGHTQTIFIEDLPKLKYTEAVLLETLRIFPPLPLVARYINTDVDVGKRIIPKGANYILSIFHLHRDPKYWPDPFKFDPSRFLPGKIENIQPYTYIPFSGGPRDCIGRAQAMMLMKTTIANVIRNFKINSDVKSLADIRLSSCLTMKATRPLDCQFIPR